MSKVAFGKPGVAPTWCSSDKDFVTTSLGSSRLWATVGHGIINEVYWPNTGSPQIRDFGFCLVGANRWIDLKRVARYHLVTHGPYLPALTIVHSGDDYELHLEVLPDPRRDVLLVRFKVNGPYRLVAMIAPHLESTGNRNHAWITDGHGFASRGRVAACFMADRPLLHLSCGYSGASDGWQDLTRHGSLTYEFSQADDGTVAISGEAQGTCGTLALGFAEEASGARTLARTSLADGFDTVRDEFLQAWKTWGEQLRLPRPTALLGDAGLLSAAVLKIHEDNTYPGAVVASLSIPWGNRTNTLGGYHLVWPRDSTLSAFALLGAHQTRDVQRMLGHLIAMQDSNGRWPQNYFPSGDAFWTGSQLDETGFPVLLAAKLRELQIDEMHGTAEMVRAAVAFIARSGPSSDQDRWEENPGVSPFTIAVAISALIAARPWLSPAENEYVESLADDWNDRLEGWCYAEDTFLARQLGVAGHYVRISPPARLADHGNEVQLRNRNGETISATALVSMAFTYLVRLGLRDAKDPRVLDTIRVVDHVLGVETPSGFLYHRYNCDGYGEHKDGAPFDGSGIGRAWPLLVGERGHVAMMAGESAIPYLQTMWNCASEGGLLPEQVWDGDPIPAHGLAKGRPSGSAMPLLWTHAEFLKLLIASESGRPLELLKSVEEHFRAARTQHSGTWHWRTEVPVHCLERGRPLFIEDRLPFSLHLGFDGWRGVEDREAIIRPFGIWAVSLTADELSLHTQIDFTRRFATGWEGTDHRVLIDHSPVKHKLASTANQ